MLHHALTLRVAVAILAALEPATHAETRPKLRIRLYNPAKLSRRNILSSTAEATRLLAQAGVDTMWLPGPPGAPVAAILTSDFEILPHPAPPEPRDYLIVAIVPEAPRSYPDALGYALPETPNGVDVKAFNDHIEAAHVRRVTFAELLGCVLAHEVGHVLLGTDEHSEIGIMKARWGTRDFHDVACGRLRFDGAQSRVMKRSVLLRFNRPSRPTYGSNPQTLSAVVPAT